MAKITLILFLILSLFSCSTEKVIEVDVAPVPAVNEEIAPIPSFEESVPFEDAEEIVVTAEENTEAHPQDDVEPLEEVESESEAVLRPAEEIVDEIGELITGVVAEEDSAEPSVSTVEEDVAKAHLFLRGVRMLCPQRFPKNRFWITGSAMTSCTS